MAKRSQSSQRWLQEHFTDPYVKEAQRLGYRSRAAFKLIEIQEKDHIIKPGMSIVDLGAAPGGWSQIAWNLLKGKGQIIALDILPMEDLPGVISICGDFQEEIVLEKLTQTLDGKQIDLVICDMAPNMSGIDAVDQAKGMYLTELALDFAVNHLKKGGDFLVKAFQGRGYDEYHRALKQHFDKVIIRKPKASRQRSAEMYLLARGKK